MPSLSSRKQVSATASGRKVYVRFQQLTGVSNGQGGFVGGGTWSDVPGLTNVPVTLRTWSPYERFMAQQLYPNVESRRICAGDAVSTSRSTCACCMALTSTGYDVSRIMTKRTRTSFCT